MEQRENSMIILVDAKKKHLMKFNTLLWQNTQPVRNKRNYLKKIKAVCENAMNNISRLWIIERSS